MKLKRRASSVEVEEVSSLEVNEGLKEKASGSQTQEQLMEESEERLLNLQRDLLVLVSNIPTAADARESLRRTKQETANRLRSEQLENYAKSSQEKFAEINNGWSVVDNEKMTAQELQDLLNNQQKLWSALREDMNKPINELKQELKIGNDNFVKDLRSYTKELDLMIERMTDTTKTLTKANREEMAYFKTVLQQETEALLTRDRSEWEQCATELSDKTLAWLTEKQKKMEENKVEIHDQMLDICDQLNTFQLEHNRNVHVERECSRTRFAHTSVAKLEKEKQQADLLTYKHNMSRIKSNISSLKTKNKKLIAQFNCQTKLLTEKSRLSAKHQKNNQRYENTKMTIEKKIDHFAGANVVQLEEMWLMIEEEMKQLVEEVIALDSLICEQHLGLAWEKPNLAFMERQAKSPAHQAVSKSSHKMPSSQSSPQHAAAWDPSEDEAYWERVCNIISEDKVKLWEAAEKQLHHYIEVLTEISDVIPEAQSLKQQNDELRILLLQSQQL
ncbi:dynein regulatory complex protein 1 isoform X2 [Cheilinus undulatus]|uniref:dynein regulatory complex protein 1 isoform X2 n=1 Tax=Cheilinus undulatus TaxID=241271 RepID=UPI001BD66FAD|nr:dynein regulatory complex protein 1 isoform X2 [Cheilinus undulatus]